MMSFVVKKSSNRLKGKCDFSIKNAYIDKLADIVNEYNNIFYRTIKMKPVDVKSSTYIAFDKHNIKEDSKFEVGNHVTISKYKNIFTRGYAPNWWEENFVIKKVKNTVPWVYVMRSTL